MKQSATEKDNEVFKLREEKRRVDDALKQSLTEKDKAQKETSALQEEKKKLEIQMDTLKKDIEDTRQAHALDDSVMQLGLAVVLEFDGIKKQLKVKEGQSSHTNTTMTSSDPTEFAQQVSNFVKKLNEDAQQIKASLTNRLSKAAIREANLKAQIAALKHNKEVSDSEGGDSMHIEKPRKSKTPSEEKAAAKRRKVHSQKEAEISKEEDIP